MKAEITVSFPELLKLPAAKTLNPILKDEFANTAITWHKKYRPQHFQMKAFSLYGYQPRSPKYVRRKMRQLHHQLPLVFLGAARELSEHSRVEATHRYGRAVYPSLRKLNFRRSPSAPNMREEFERVADSEEQALAQQMETRLVRKLNQLAEKR